MHQLLKKIDLKPLQYLQDTSMFKSWKIHLKRANEWFSTILDIELKNCVLTQMHQLRKKFATFDSEQVATWNVHSQYKTLESYAPKIFIGIASESDFFWF